MYEELFEEVRRYLALHDGEAAKSAPVPFRKRSEHTRRVFTWAKRLSEDSRIPAIDRDALLIAALFHDVGYATAAKGAGHAGHSAVLFEEYAGKHGYPPERSGFISFLIRNHSKKELILAQGTPLELVLLMEADLLDETGALSIVWDCMIEGAAAGQSFPKTYRHIQAYSGKILGNNPMLTEKAKELWRDKQRLTGEFIRQLAYDLCEYTA